MKSSPSTAKLVRMHWTKNTMLLMVEKFCRKKKPLDEESETQILEVHRTQTQHLDWHTSNHDVKKVHVCVLLNDSSPRILAGSTVKSAGRMQIGNVPESNGDGIKWFLKDIIIRSEYIKFKHSGLYRI
jgi:hypothetical protein